MKVIRTLIIEGPEEWVKKTLEQSLVAVDRPFNPKGDTSITETTRIIVEGAAESHGNKDSVRLEQATALN